MSLVSYKQLIYVVEDFASQHQQIQRFKAEFEEQMPNFSTEGEAFPMLFMVPIGSVYSPLNTFQVRFYVYDLIQKDRSNINTIISDTHLILNDLKLWFQEGGNYELELIGDPTARPINNSLMDYAAGWTMDVTFQIGNYCVEAIPFSGSPVIDAGGVDITYSRWLTCDTLLDCMSGNTEITNYLESFLSGGTGGQDIFVTGGTYNNTTGTATFTNTTGGTFNVSGFTTGGTSTDTFVTGFTFNPATYILNLSQNDGSSFNANLSILSSDVTITGGTYNPSNGSATFTNNTGGTFTVTGFLTGATGSDSYWTSGSTWNGTNYPIKAKNDSGLDATGDYAVAEGQATLSSGVASHAEGSQTTASGNYSHAEGQSTWAKSDWSHAEGQGTLADGQTAHAEGWLTTAINHNTHAEGDSTTASGEASHAQNKNTIAAGDFSHAEGDGSIATGSTSHAEGFQTSAFGDNSHVEGRYSVGLGNSSHAEGLGTTSIGNNSHSGGYLTRSIGESSFVHGYNSQANGNYSAVFGYEITGTTDNTVFVPRLNVGILSGGTSVTNLGIDVNGFVVAGSGSSGTDIYVTGGTYNNTTGTATFTNNANGTFNVTGFTTGGTGGVTSVTAGTGLSGNSTTGNVTLINTAPDQVVSIVNGNGMVISGTYPNFTASTESEGVRITKTNAFRTANINTTSLVKVYSFFIPANTVSSGDTVTFEGRIAKGATTNAASAYFYVNTTDTPGGAQIGIRTTAANNRYLSWIRTASVAASSGETYVYNNATTAIDADWGSVNGAITPLNIDWTIDNYAVFAIQPTSSLDTWFGVHFMIEIKKFST